MEFANIKYITRNGRLFHSGNSNTRAPFYGEAKRLKPVIVDDFLELNTEEGNVALLNGYAEKSFSIVPICRRPAQKQEDRPDFPSRVLLEITSKCNLKCVMCPRNVLTRPEIHMPKDAIIRCIDEIDKNRVEGLWLYNIGEALLHPDFEDIFNYCQRKKNLGSVWLSTNGQELSDKMIDFLINSNLTFLNYSLNAMNAKSYDLISPNGNYELLVSNLERLLEKKKKYHKMGTPPWIRVQMVDQPQVFSEIDSFFSYYSGACEILSINCLEAFNQNVSQNIEYAKQRERRKKKNCNRIKRGDCFIFSDGEVSFCDTDFNHEMSIGNIHGSSLKEIWNGKTYENYRMLNTSGRLNEIEMCGQCLDYDL